MRVFNTDNDNNYLILNMKLNEFMANETIQIMNLKLRKIVKLSINNNN